MASIDQSGQIVTPPAPTTVNPNVPTVTVTPQQVYSAANVSQTITNPVAKPNLSDPFGTYSFYMNSPEIQAARAESQRVAEAINASRQGLRTTTTALQNQNEQAMGGTGASINLIGRQVGRARELTSNELAALSENQLATQAYLDTLTQDATAKYQIAEQQRAQVQDLIRQTGGKAGISYADTYESAVAKADSYIKKQEKEAKKEAYKDSLKQTALQLGIKTAGKNTKELEKSLKKYYKSEREYSDKIKQIELQAKQKSLAGTGTGTVGAVLSTAGAGLTRGEGGFVDGNKYLAARDQAIKSGKVTSAEFDASYGSMLSDSDRMKYGITALSPAERAAELTKQQDLEKAKQTATKALDLVNSLETSSGKSSAVGAKGPLGGLLGGWVVPGTAAADFVSQFDSLKSLLTLENMGIMKGVLSDSDMKVIQQASSALNRNMSETEFNKELAKVKNVLSAKVGLSSETGGVGTVVEKDGVKWRKRSDGNWEEL